MTHLAISALRYGLVLLLFAEALLLVRRWPMVIVAFVGAQLVWPVFGGTVLLHAGGALKVSDVVDLLAAGYAALRGRAIRQNSRGPIALILLTLAVLYSEVVGFQLFQQSAINFGRPFINMLSLAAFAFALDLERYRNQLFRVWVWIGLSLSVLACLNALRYGVGSASSGYVDPSTGLFVTGRILIAAQAVAVGFAAIIAASLYRETRAKWYAIVSTALFGVVILAQHRSVWLAIAVGMIAPAILRRRLRTSHYVALLVAAAALLGVFATGFAKTAQDGIANSVQSASLNSGTLGDRQGSWASLLSRMQDSGLGTIVKGFPMGTDYARDLGAGVEDYSPHNWYVTVFYNTGLVGLIPFLLALTRGLRRGSPDWYTLQLTFVITGAVYMFAYSLDLTLALFLPLAIGGFGHFDQLEMSDRDVHLAGELQLH